MGVNTILLFLLFIVMVRVNRAAYCWQTPGTTKFTCDLDKMPSNSSGSVGRSVTHLQLKKMDQMRLGKQTFSSLKRHVHLVILQLSNNGIVELPDGVFEPLKTIEEIVLSANKLSTISFDRFAGNQKLQTLFLQANNIEVIEPIHHKAEFSIRELWISNNKLVNISELCKLRRLKFLTLTNNPKLNFEFNCWNALTHLFLRNTNLKRLNDNYQTFVGLMQLELLDLGGNELESFVNFPKLENLESLDIDWNQLRKVNLKELKTTFKRLNKVNLCGNRLNDLQFNSVSKDSKELGIIFDYYCSQTGDMPTPRAINLSFGLIMTTSFVMFVVDTLLSFFFQVKY